MDAHRRAFRLEFVVSRQMTINNPITLSASEAAKVLGTRSKHACEAAPEWERPRLLQTRAARCLPPGRSRSVAQISGRPQYLGRRCAVAKEPHWATSGLRDGLSPSQPTAGEGPPELFRGGDLTAVRCAQEHCARLAQARVVGHRRPAADVDSRPGAVAVPARAPAEGEAVVRAGPDLLHRMPRAEGAGWEDGGMSP